MITECPACSSTDGIESTCVGLVYNVPDGHDHDPNEHRCPCGHAWFAVCDECGWTAASWKVR